MKIFYLITATLLCLKAYSLTINSGSLGSMDFFVVENHDSGKRVFQVFMEDNSGLQDLVAEFNDKNELDFFLNKIGKHSSKGPSISAIEEKFNYEETEFDPEVLFPKRGFSIWKVTRSWNASWERKYAKWLEEEVSPDFFVDYNIPSDCADIIVALRWIFSRNNGLPAAHHLAGSRKLLTNYTYKSTWGNLPKANNWHEDRRFMSSLRYLMRNTYTGSLKYDVYPIKIEKEHFRPGSIHLSTKLARHAMLFKSFELNKDSKEAVKIIESTLPVKVRRLYEKPFLIGSVEPPAGGGIVNLRWAIVTESGISLRSTSGMPGFSMEQYEEDFLDIAFGLFNLSVMAKMNPNITDGTFLDLMADGLKSELNKRDFLVIDGYAFCKKNNCRPGTTNYFNWSTPSRDKKIKGVIRGMKTVLKNSDDDLEDDFRKILNKPFTIRSLFGSQFPIGEIIYIFENNGFSSDPRDIPSKRWGLGPSLIY